MANMLSSNEIRNIGFIGPIDAGKTTIIEHIHRYSRLPEHTPSSEEIDWLSWDCIERTIIIGPVTTCHWQNHHLNIVAVPPIKPCSPEFERAMRVLDGLVVVISSGKMQNTRDWQQADKYHVPRICFINKMDTHSADFWYTIETIKRHLGPTPVPIQIPIGSGSTFEGFVDLLEERAITFANDYKEKPVYGAVPPELVDITRQHRTLLIERIVETDEALTRKYLEDEAITKEELKVALRKAVRSQVLMPVLCGSAFRSKGVQAVLDAMIDYLPSPLDRAELSGRHSDTAETITPQCDEQAPFCAQVFKVLYDYRQGRACYIRIYAGTLKQDTVVWNSSRRCEAHIKYLRHIDLNGSYQDREEVRAGDICVVIAQDENCMIDDTLCDPQYPLVLERLPLPEMLLSVTVKPQRDTDQERLVTALRRLMEETATFQLATGPDAAPAVIYAAEELQLEIIIDHLKRTSRIELTIGPLQVLYRESDTHVLLEPIMLLEVSMPNNAYAEFIGEVLRDLGKRRGAITNMEFREEIMLLQAQIPLAELLRYEYHLLRTTWGRASCTITFLRYQPVEHV
jgi:elongation factor G